MLGDRRRDVTFALDDLISFVLLWAVVNALLGQWSPVMLAGIIGLLLD